MPLPKLNKLSIVPNAPGHTTHRPLKLVPSGHTAPITCLRLLDRSLFSGSEDGTVREFQRETTELLSVYK